VALNDIKRKLKRLPAEIRLRAKRIPARAMEKVRDLAYFIRTGRVKMKDDIRRYAEETGVVADIHPDDLIFRFVIEFPGFLTREQAVKYYFHDGANSAKKLGDLLFSQLGFKRSADTSLLEFASGYGCVTRHLAGELAPVKVVSCDIHGAACAFIESAIGVKTVRSATRPEDIAIESHSFDVVFALSFFSHMPERTWGRWLKTLFDKVKPGGCLIFTTHGMTTWENLGKPAIPESGIWFAPSSEQKDLDVADYGSTIVTPEYVRTAVENILHQPVLRLDKAAWWGHQDLYVVRNSRLG
jgi:SAM-dependent methyltransferase